MPGLLCAALLTGCAGSAIEPSLRDGDANAPRIEAPAAWVQGAAAPAVGDWLGEWIANWNERFPGTGLGGHVEQALRSNHGLAQQLEALRQAAEATTVARADRLPSFAFGLDARSVDGVEGLARSERWNAVLDARLELDAFGRLDAAERRARLQYAAQRARYLDAALDLVADTTRAHVQWLEARQLLALFEARLANLEASLAIIERGYRAGLNEALDLYLAQSSVAQERANVAAQRQALQAATARLQLLVVDYPGGTVDGVPGTQPDAAVELPVLTAEVGGGVPAELVKRRPDLDAAWLDLLAADAGLAVAHRARFPRVSLSAAVERGASGFSDLTAANDVSTALAASLLQPIFEWGRLEALEDIERSRVRERERRLLDLVQRAFAEVETALARLAHDRTQYEALVFADRNASAAASLAFAQYRRGLVDYTTVLEAQRRAFDAQTGVVRLRARLLLDRVDIHAALGGYVEPPGLADT